MSSRSIFGIQEDLRSLGKDQLPSPSDLTAVLSRSRYALIQSKPKKKGSSFECYYSDELVVFFLPDRGMV